MFGIRLFGITAAMILLQAFGPVSACAETTHKTLMALQTGDDLKGWQAVGRLNIGSRGFAPAR
jgi:hypothetical protein